MIKRENSMIKKKIMSLFIVFFLASISLPITKGLDLNEEYEIQDDFKLILIEVENIEDYASKEQFVEVIVGFNSSIEIHQKEEKIREFGEVVSIYSNSSESLEEKWKSISQTNYLPVAEILSVYKYFHGICVAIPESWIGSLSKAWFTKYIENNAEGTFFEDTLDWGVDHINAERVWGNGVEDAVDIVPNEPDGTGVNILILDYGWDDDHEDLSVDSENYKFFRGWQDTDWDSHGTHITGIINCQDNEENYIGVAPGATVYMGKVGDKYFEPTFNSLIDGIEWGIGLKVDIISISGGWYEYSLGLEEMLWEAYARGIFIVAAIGNNMGTSASYPAYYDTVMAVGSVNSNNEKAETSNYGTGLEIMAPGDNIYSTTINNNYAQKSGTSMACPMVAGTAALIKNKYPELTGPVIRDILINSTTDINETGWDEYTGYGVVNAAAAIELAADYNQEMAEEFDDDGDDFLHVRTIHQIVHGTSGEESFPIYLRGNYENKVLYSQRMYFKIYMRVYYKDSWFRLFPNPSSGTDYYWDPLPSGMIEWSGSFFDYEKYPDGDLWRYRIGTDYYYFPYGCFSDGTSTSLTYSTESNSNDWTYLGYFGVASSGKHDVLLELDVDNTIAADYANGYMWEDLATGTFHTVYIEKIYIKIVAEYKYYFFGWRLDKSIPITLGDGDDPDFNDIDLASGSSPW
jgi:subtilisin